VLIRSDSLLLTKASDGSVVCSLKTKCFERFRLTFSMDVSAAFAGYSRLRTDPRLSNVFSTLARLGLSYRSDFGSQTSG
jgi:hypothetical protein